MENELLALSITEIGVLLRTRQCQVPDLVEACLEQERQTRELNAWNDCFAEQAREVARASQMLLDQGYDAGPLHGIPVGIKANIAMAGQEMHAGSQILSGNIAEKDATVVKRLKQAGAIILGTTNMHEFAWGGTTNNPHYGASANPWNKDHIPAGSSGGSGVAAAVRSALATLGTDTGGSIRLPASMNGVTGLRPGIGRLSTEGIFPLATSLDTVGPLAAYATDCALVFSALTQEKMPAPPATLSSMRIGLLGGYSETVQPDIASAYEALRYWFVSQGAHQKTLSLHGLEEAVNALVLINLAEPSAIHLPWLTATPEAYGDDVRALLQTGLGVTAVEYLQAQRYRTGLREQLLAALQDVDVIMVPTLPFTAPRKGQHLVEIGSNTENVLTGNMKFNALASLGGLPAISLPAGFDQSGLPIGMQLIGPDGSEGKLLALAARFQQDTDYHRQIPVLARS